MVRDLIQGIKNEQGGYGVQDEYNLDKNGHPTQARLIASRPRTNFCEDNDRKSGFLGALWLDVGSSCIGQPFRASDTLTTSTDKSNGLSRDAFFAAFKAETFGGGGFHADIFRCDAACTRNVLAHRLAIRRKLRCLRSDDAIDIKDLEAFFTKQIRSCLEQLERIGIFIGWIGVGEMLAETPRRAAPKRASAIAWSSTSASE